MTHRGTSNSNSRGSSYQRRQRRAFLVEKFGSKTGKTIRCFHCKKRMHVNARVRRWEVDRFPVCGHAGGTYARDNIVPACPKCNGTRCTVAKKCRADATTGRVPKFSRIVVRAA